MPVLKPLPVMLKGTLIAVIGLGLVACASKFANINSTDEAFIEDDQYQATIVRTDYGIPHITADSWGSLGFGEAYAAAEDHVCNMALALLQAQGESAAVFGPGDKQSNLSRDIVIKALDIPGKAKTALAAQAPDIRAWIEGYTAGYNHYLATVKDGFGSWCNGASWVKAVTPDAFMAQYLTLVQTLPRVGSALIAAKLPEAEVAKTPSDLTLTQVDLASLEHTFSDLRLEGMGSNAWAIGKESAETGRGLLLANPHYPWFGIARFWEKHLTIPGTYNAYGAGLIGTPGVAIGFNQSVGWSHTVSDSKRTVVYQLQLDPNNPQRYRWDDDWRALEPVEVAVNVLTDAGMESHTHTLWFSHQGPLIHLPGLSNDPFTAFAIRDANAQNIHVLAQWQAMGMASDMDSFIDAHRKFNAMPWVNTIAASADGRAVYLDNSTVGALSEEAIQAWKAQVEAVPALKQLYLTQGLVILDGSNSATEWRQTDAPIPHTEPFDKRPLIESPHFVFNANDSYWLTDPSKPAVEYSPLYGAINSPRSVRTRMNIELLNNNNVFGYAGSEGKFSMTEVQQALFANDSLTAHLLLPDLLAACNSTPVRTVDNVAVDLTKACAILAAWDRKLNLDSRGAVLFREWLTRYPYTDTFLSQGLFAEPFDPSAPVTTPRGLTNPDVALDRLAQAVTLLQRAGIALDAKLGDYQRAHRAGKEFAVHGGKSREGIANLQESTRRGQNYKETPHFTGSDDYVGDSESLSKTGYNVIHGSSFIMTLEFTDEGPKAQAILSYSQSGDPASAHFSDQTVLYRDKQWRDVLFTEDQIKAHRLSEKTIFAHR